VPQADNGRLGGIDLRIVRYGFANNLGKERGRVPDDPLDLRELLALVTHTESTTLNL